MHGQDTEVVVIGGGISGLAAARSLVQNGLRVKLFERERECGGVIRTDRADGFIVDTGPDTLLAHKPAALALVRDVGLGDRLVDPLPDRTTYLVRDAALRTLPQTSALGLPTDLRTLIEARAFSWRGKLRMAAEPLVRVRKEAGDESIASFVGRRFGREAVTSVAEPVLAGLHRGDASRLSVQALFPALANAERTAGSVARFWRSAPRSAGSGSLSLREGIGELVLRLHDRLPPGTVQMGSRALAVERQQQLLVRLADGASISCRAVVMATPAFVTARLVEALDDELGRLCGRVRYVSAVNVALGYRREDVRHPLRGWGCVVSKQERRAVRSVSWVSSKWPHRAPAGHVLLRAALADCGDESDREQTDSALVSQVHGDLADLLSVTAAPVFARVYRRPQAMPQLEVGHLERMQHIERRLAELPGVFLTASGFRGVGLPDCIADAQRVAAEVSAYVRSRSTAA